MTYTHEFIFHPKWPKGSPTSVVLSGTFDNWSRSVVMERIDIEGFSPIFITKVSLPLGQKVEYKYFADDCKLKYSPTEFDIMAWQHLLIAICFYEGHINNYLIVPSSASATVAREFLAHPDLVELVQERNQALRTRLAELQAREDKVQARENKLSERDWRQLKYDIGKARLKGKKYLEEYNRDPVERHLKSINVSDDIRSFVHTELETIKTAFSTVGGAAPATFETLIRAFQAVAQPKGVGALSIGTILVYHQPIVSLLTLSTIVTLSVLQNTFDSFEKVEEQRRKLMELLPKIPDVLANVKTLSESSGIGEFYDIALTCVNELIDITIDLNSILSKLREQGETATKTRKLHIGLLSTAAVGTVAGVGLGIAAFFTGGAALVGLPLIATAEVAAGASWGAAGFAVAAGAAGVAGHGVGIKWSNDLLRAISGLRYHVKTVMRDTLNIITLLDERATEMAMAYQSLKLHACLCPLFWVFKFITYPLDNSEQEVENTPYGQIRVKISKKDDVTLLQEVAAVNGIWKSSSVWTIDEEAGELRHYRRTTFTSDGKELKVVKKELPT
ncbi:hypothetical protein HDU93_002510 [Gonapodya sp. JEL0774]|nr:hypothetical protein HDU93_002510 [Gonapodya sp. JEL0774]